MWFSFYVSNELFICTLKSWHINNIWSMGRVCIRFKKDEETKGRVLEDDALKGND